MANSNIVKFKDKDGSEYSYLFIDLKSGIFYVRIRIGNKVRVSSLETTNLKDAKARIKKKIFDLHKKDEEEKEKKKRALYHHLPENVLVKDYYDKMIAEKIAEEVKDSTMTRINSVWKYSLDPFWGLMNVNDVNKEKVSEFNDWHRKKRPGVQFVNVYKYLGNIFSLMEKDGIFLSSGNSKPVLELTRTELRHHAKQKGRYITDDEIKEVLKNSNPITKLFILIAFSTGMRKMEIGALELSRLKLHNGRYTAILDTDDTKTGLARIVPIPASLTPLINEQINKKSKFLFYMKTDLQRNMSGQLIDKGWVDAKKKSNITSKTRIHDLRHTAASNMAKAGINPIVAVTILGMSFRTYQERYLKLTADDLAKACESNFARIEAPNA